MSMYDVLFTAPLDFDNGVADDYLGAFAVYATPGHHRPSVKHPQKYVAWVCDPKASFVIDDAVLDEYPNLHVLATPSTGTNHIDLDACKRRGVKVLSLLDDRAGLETISASAEFTFKLLLDALRIPPARELQGLQVALIGYGRIGRKLHRYLGAFGAQVIPYDPYKKVYGSYGRSLATNFEASDAVIICCALTPETKGMITADLIRSMKHGAALINTARGEIVDEHGLLAVMDERPDLRVALDVLAGEVTGTANPEPFKARGAIITPHIAGETFDSRTKAARIILNLLKKELQHEV